MIIVAIIIAIIACIGVAREWHLYRIADAVERAVLIERRRVSAYLREQARVAEAAGGCHFLSELGREKEKYAAAVLEETAAEISEMAHHRVQS